MCHAELNHRPPARTAGCSCTRCAPAPRPLLPAPSSRTAPSPSSTRAAAAAGAAGRGVQLPGAAFQRRGGAGRTQLIRSARWAGRDQQFAWSRRGGGGVGGTGGHGAEARERFEMLGRRVLLHVTLLRWLAAELDSDGRPSWLFRRGGVAAAVVGWDCAVGVAGCL